MTRTADRRAVQVIDRGRYYTTNQLGQKRSTTPEGFLVRSSGSVHSARLWYRSPASARQITIQMGYFKKLDNVAGSQIVPSVTDVAYNLNSTITLPGTDTGWVEVNAALPYRRPPKGFDFVGFRIRVHDMASSEVLYIDDVEIHQW